ncbi:hypothetical protein [Phocicoccus schoeneichii]|uniref:hypothetical protein n=1 Tax=Phocicoccus schoeneichii TaxID=1812261 RepID=UPI003D11886C
MELLFYSVLYLSNNKFEEELNQYSYTYVTNINDVNIKPNKEVNIGIYSLNHGEERVSTDLNILTYYNEDELKSNLKDFDVSYVIRSKFTDGEE